MATEDSTGSVASLYNTAAAIDRSFYFTIRQIHAAFSATQSLFMSEEFYTKSL